MSRPLKIGMVCYPSFGGSGVVAVDLAAGLARRGHQVHLLATAAPSRVMPNLSGLHFHPIPVLHYPLFEHPQYALAVASAIVDAHRQHAFDIVHVHYAVPHAVSAYLALQVLGSTAPKLVVSLHGTDVTHTGSDKSYNEVTRFAVAKAQAVIAPSQFLVTAAYEQLGLHRSTQIDVVPNFVDAEHFAPAAKSNPQLLDTLFPHAPPGKTLFHVSNFRPVKRVQDTLEVLQHLNQQMSARLVLVGSGPDLKAVKQQAAERGLSDRVCFFGDRGDFLPYLQQADAFIFPSSSESFGLAALEALSVGVPVFAYRVGGIPDVVAPGTGVLVEPFDVKALGQAISGVLANSQDHAAMKKAARQHVLSHFLPGPAIERYENIYKR